MKRILLTGLICFCSTGVGWCIGDYKIAPPSTQPTYVYGCSFHPGKCDCPNATKLHSYNGCESVEPGGFCAEIPWTNDINTDCLRTELGLAKGEKLGDTLTLTVQELPYGTHGSEEISLKPQWNFSQDLGSKWTQSTVTCQATVIDSNGKETLFNTDDFNKPVNVIFHDNAVSCDNHHLGFTGSDGKSRSVLHHETFANGTPRSVAATLDGKSKTGIILFYSREDHDKWDKVATPGKSLKDALNEAPLTKDNKTLRVILGLEAPTSDPTTPPAYQSSRPMVSPQPGKPVVKQNEAEKKPIQQKNPPKQTISPSPVPSKNVTQVRITPGKAIVTPKAKEPENQQAAPVQKKQGVVKPFVKPAANQKLIANIKNLAESKKVALSVKDAEIKALKEQNAKLSANQQRSKPALNMSQLVKAMKNNVPLKQVSNPVNPPQAKQVVANQKPASTPANKVQSRSATPPVKALTQKPIARPTSTINTQAKSPVRVVSAPQKAVVSARAPVVKQVVRTPLTKTNAQTKAVTTTQTKYPVRVLSAQKSVSQSKLIAPTRILKPIGLSHQTVKDTVNKQQQVNLQSGKPKPKLTTPTKTLPRKLAVAKKVNS